MKLNIVIPMAGAGTRFSKAGYEIPKPLISVNNVPMIQLVINNLMPKNIPHRFIFICQEEHCQKYDLPARLSAWASDCIVIKLNGLTQGAACTVLSAKEFINTQEPLMIANSDQFVDVTIDDYINELNARHLDGLIMTMTANDPKWSFVKFNDRTNFVEKVVEKEVISDHATVGIYNFARGEDFVKYAETMIEENNRTNGEFYVAPVYNYLINKHLKIGAYNVGCEGMGMYGLGTPEDLNKFLNIHSLLKS